MAAEITIAYCSNGDPGAQSIKLANAIHNLSDIVDSDSGLAVVYV